MWAGSLPSPLRGSWDMRTGPAGPSSHAISLCGVEARHGQLEELFGARPFGSIITGSHLVMQRSGLDHSYDRDRAELQVFLDCHTSCSCLAWGRSLCVPLTQCLRNKEWMTLFCMRVLGGEGRNGFHERKGVRLHRCPLRALGRGRARRGRGDVSCNPGVWDSEKKNC